MDKEKWGWQFVDGWYALDGKASSNAPPACPLCGQRSRLLGGFRGGKTAAAIAMCKMFPKLLAVVPNLKTMDIYIAAGVKPSQIKMPSEFRNTSFVITEVISSEDLTEKGLDLIILDEHPREGLNDGGNS